MRIAHVIPALVKGGAEKVVVDLANCAVANGDEVVGSACRLLPDVVLLDVSLRG